MITYKNPEIDKEVADRTIDVAAPIGDGERDVMMANCKNIKKGSLVWVSGHDLPVIYEGLHENGYYIKISAPDGSWEKNVYYYQVLRATTTEEIKNIRAEVNKKFCAFI